MPTKTPSAISPLSYTKAGRRFASRYQIIEEIGRGGVGAVVKAKDLTQNGEIVAIKILYPRFAANSSTLARFRREGMLARNLSHPNIVKIFEQGVTQDTESGETLHYFTMEYLAGGNLASKLAANSLSLEQIFSIMHQVASGLAHAHRNDIAHLDLKPENILIGLSFEVKVSDFSLARVIDHSEKLVGTESALGSYRYIAPEQINSTRLDFRSDIYALGILSFQMLTGELPFRASERKMLIQQHLKDALPNVLKAKPSLPAWLQPLLEAACSKDLAVRYQSGEEFIRDLEQNSGFKRRSQDSKLKFNHYFTAANGDRRILFPTAALLVLVLIGAGGFALFSRLFTTIGP